MILYDRLQECHWYGRRGYITGMKFGRTRRGACHGSPTPPPLQESRMSAITTTFYHYEMSTERQCGMPALLIPIQCLFATEKKSHEEQLLLLKGGAYPIAMNPPRPMKDW
jgi:hypothetical protein